ncbi:hypothetical protein [Blastococcus sp. SYSU DS0619]
MAEPDWNPDTGGRSLAEILREAGIESAARTARRRRVDDDDTGIRQRRADDAAAADRARYGRRSSDLQAAEQTPAHGREPRRTAPDPVTAAIPGLRPDRKPSVPHPSGPVPPLRRQAEAAGAAKAAPASGATRASAASGAPAASGAVGAQRTAGRTASRTAPAAGGIASTGPIPVVHADDVDADLDTTPRESALAWLRFAGELLIALAAGVGIYFAATVLWEMIPHLAVFLAPLAVAGLVGGVNLWRQRQGTEPVGARMLAVLVFAGTLLTIAPAATLLATS